MRCHGSVTKKLPRRCCPFAAPAAIFAGVQPSRLTLRELPISEGVALGYSQYSLPGWIVLLVVILALRHEAQRSPNPIATQQIGHYDTPPYSQYRLPG